MTLFEVDDTLTVGQLTRQLTETIRRTFRNEVWVRGQIRNLSRSARGHVYFDLIDPVPAGEMPKTSISVTLFDSNRQVVNRLITRTGNTMRIDDGVEVRIRGGVDFYAPRGQLQLTMTSIDPEYTLGRLGADRDRLLRALADDDLIEANARVELPIVPLRVGLITSAGSAAQADFVEQLRFSGYAFEITTLSSRVQGMFAPEELAAAVTHGAGLALDVIAIVRGGGARTDLAAFDAEPVARAIATCAHPVVAGIGHEVDQSVADLVAHASLKTPTACAQFLIDRVRSFDDHLTARAGRLRDLAPLAAARESLVIERTAHDLADRTQRTLDAAETRGRSAAGRLDRLVGRRIARSNERLAQLSAHLDHGARDALRRAETDCRRAAEQLRTAPQRHLRAANQRVELLEARRSAVDPAHALRRGWSITTTDDGRVVRSIHDAPMGTALHTRVSDGSIASTVSSPPTEREHP